MTSHPDHIDDLAVAGPVARGWKIPVLFIIAIGFMTALTLATYFLVSAYVSESRGASAAINIAGRQRMLSQRIAFLASEMRRGNDAAADRLEAAAALMERSQRALMEGGDLGIRRPASAALREFYLEGPNPLDSRIHAFVQAAHLVARGAPSAEAYEVLGTDAADRLLVGLDDATAMRAAESETRLGALGRVEYVLLGTMLVAILALGVFVILPMWRNASRWRRVAGQLIVANRENQKAAQHNFEALLDATPDAMLVMQTDGAVLLANAEAERLFAYGRGDLNGVNIKDLVPFHLVGEQHACRGSAEAQRGTIQTRFRRRSDRSCPRGQDLAIHHRQRQALRDGRI